MGLCLAVLFAAFTFFAFGRLCFGILIFYCKIYRLELINSVDYRLVRLRFLLIALIMIACLLLDKLLEMVHAVILSKNNWLVGDRRMPRAFRISCVAGATVSVFLQQPAVAVVWYERSRSDPSLIS